MCLICTTSRQRRGAPAFLTLILALLSLAPWGGPASAAGVRLSPAVQRELGVATRTMTLTHRAAEVDAFAKVLDPEPLVQLDTDLATAEAAAAASGAEATRASALHAADGGVSQKDVEAAVAQARSDALKVGILRRRVGLEWGPGVARMSAAARARLVRGLAAGKIALVHVDTHNDEGQAGARAVKVDIGDGSAAGVVLGPARAAEPRLQSSGLIVEVTGPSAILLSVGLTQSAHIETRTAQSGVLVPRPAIIRFKGSDWVYVRAGPGVFERRLLESPVPQADGFFVPKGVSPGDEVVTRGAAALFTAEQSLPGAPMAANGIRSLAESEHTMHDSGAAS
ncbi:MAG: hypothetical protein JWO83_3388 [Caulobacteraceae bacterium]|nr:hypothetical protein [Caulobacteraceae bacterium]